MEPLSFTDPQVRRETYVSAMVATLDGHSDGFPSLEKSIITLRRSGFACVDIDQYIDEAHQKQFDMTRKRP